METSADDSQRHEEPDEAVRARPAEPETDEAGVDDDPPSDHDYFVPV
jgi:hypothetical protein